MGRFDPRRNRHREEVDPAFTTDSTPVHAAFRQLPVWNVRCRPRPDRVTGVGTPRNVAVGVSEQAGADLERIAHVVTSRSEASLASTKYSAPRRRPSGMTSSSWIGLWSRRWRPRRSPEAKASWFCAFLALIVGELHRCAWNPGVALPGSRRGCSALPLEEARRTRARAACRRGRCRTAGN